MLSVSALSSPGATPVVSFADRAVAALLTGGGEIASVRRALPTGRLRYSAERRVTGSLLVEVAESPYGSDRAAIEHAAHLLRSRGFRAVQFAGKARLLVCADRGSR